MSDLSPHDRGELEARIAQKETERAKAAKVAYLVQFDSLRGYVVQKVTTEDVFITDDPKIAYAFVEGEAVSAEQEVDLLEARKNADG